MKLTLPEAEEIKKGLEERRSHLGLLATEIAKETATTDSNIAYLMKIGKRIDELARKWDDAITEARQTGLATVEISGEKEHIS